MIEFSDFGNRGTDGAETGEVPGISGKGSTGNLERQYYLKEFLEFLKLPACLEGSARRI
jgi:hypothetical protein